MKISAKSKLYTAMPIFRAGRGTLSCNFLEKELGVSAPMSNFNTMNRLTTMSREIHAQQEKH